MSAIAEPHPRGRRRRADAERSIAAILDSAVRVLRERPQASIEDIAEAAGVTRQTIYAHFDSREVLINAVIDRVTEEVVAAIDAADLEKGPPAAALLRLLDASWQTFERYPFLSHLPPLSPQQSYDRHEAIFERLERLIRRGQETGDFNRQLSPTWLLAATIGLAHAAGEEVGAGRMTADDAINALRSSVLRVFGIDALPQRRVCV
jgi:AcrR family transcriptional regulator